jgi:endo-1,4-beta-xylanase
MNKHLNRVAFGITVTAVLAAGLARPSEISSLREKFAGKFLIGVAVDGDLATEYAPAEMELIRSQFSALTPANGMKMWKVQAVEGQFDFQMGDGLVEFAAAGNQKVCGHTLVWARDERTPEWFFKDGDKQASRELLLKRLKTHIEKVAGHFRGKLVSWDVVNEPLGDGSDYLRPSKWMEIAGEDFIASRRSGRDVDPERLRLRVSQQTAPDDASAQLAAREESAD